jgi:hypothetical protein
MRALTTITQSDRFGQWRLLYCGHRGWQRCRVGLGSAYSATALHRLRRHCMGGRNARGCTGVIDEIDERNRCLSRKR